jgi:hypothetical protein
MRMGKGLQGRRHFARIHTSTLIDISVNVKPIDG